MELSSSQQHAYQYIITNLPKEHVILLEGSAGTGKTTLTKTICNYYRQIKNVLVCTYTYMQSMKCIYIMKLL
jgi:tRNA A37 threonylcarbamoyladenosine biosynthesis protein TsaE